MAVDFSRYLPPGVYTEAVSGPTVGLTASTPRAVGIFGDSLRYQKDTESLTIPADSGGPVSTVPLRNPGVKQSTMVVRNAATGVSYTLTTDYTVQTVTGDVAGTTADDLTTIRRVTGGAITAGTIVQVEYQYTDLDYFVARTFYDFDDVRDTYGAPFTATGAVQSELTLAARFAFENGADRVVCVAVNAASTTPTTQEYTNALDLLKNIADVSVIVCANGDPAIFPAIKTHVNSQTSDGYERRAILGYDGVATDSASSARQAQAATLKSKRVALVSPGIISYYNPETQKVQLLGSQYVAAAIAGRAASSNPAEPLTRKDIAGFYDVPEKMSESTKNAESEAGLMVFEASRRGPIRVRHGVTTDGTSLYSREWSIVGQEDALAFRVREYLENDSLVGSLIDDLTLARVKASADSALSSLVSDRFIRGYDNLKVRQLSGSPDVIEVRFEWQAAAPLNYIVVRFSVNISTGTVTDLVTV